MHGACTMDASLDPSTLSGILETVETVPESVRARACTLRVRVLRAKARVDGCTVETLPPPRGALDELAAFLRRVAIGGDTIRVEWLDGAGAAIPTGETGRKGSWTVPIEAGPAPHPNPAPAPAAPPPVATAADRVPFPGIPEPAPAAAMTAPAPPVSPSSFPQVPPGQEVGAMLAASLTALNGTLHMALNTNGQLAGQIDRLVASHTVLAQSAVAAANQTAQVAAGQLGASTAAWAREHGKVAEALGRNADKAVDAASNAVGHAAELNGEMIGRASTAVEERVQAEIRAAKAEAENPAGDVDAPKPTANAEGTINAVTQLVKEGASAIRGAGRDAAEEALAEVLTGLAKGKVPKAVVDKLKGMSAEERGQVGATLMAALA